MLRIPFSSSWRVPLPALNVPTFDLSVTRDGFSRDTVVENHAFGIPEDGLTALSGRDRFDGVTRFGHLATATVGDAPSFDLDGDSSQAGSCEGFGSELALSVGAAWLMFFKIPTVMGIAALWRWLSGGPKPVEERARRTVLNLPSYAFSAGEIAGLKSRYARLYAASPVRNPDGTVSFDAATRFERGGISVLHLKGDAFEMAFQHGALMREEIARGVVPLMSRKIQNTIRYALGDGSRFFGSVSWLLNRFVHAPLLARMPEVRRKELFAMSEGAGIPLHETLAAMTTYETIHILAKYAIGEAKLAPREACNSCSSLVVWGERAGGRMVVGRNFDNALNGHFDANPAVVYFEPTDGGMKYASVTSAGVHTGGITAMNEAGIFVAVHTVPTRETSPRAAMMLPVLTEVMRSAKSFDEAVKIISGVSAAVGWAILLVSTKENRAATVEMTSGKTVVRESDGGKHVQTNHFLHPAMTDSLMYVNASADDDSRARYERLGNIVDAAGTSFDARTAMAALADQRDPFHGVERGNENTVGVHTNVSSVVVLPEEGRFFVANGTAPVAHNSYVEFPSPESFVPETFATADHEIVPNDGWRSANPEKFEAVRVFIEAKKLYEYRRDISGSLALLKRVTALDPENSAYHFNLGAMASKAGEDETALKAFSDAVNAGYPAHKVAVARYYRGRMLAARESSAARAREDLSAVASDSNACPKLRAAAAKALDGLARGGTLPFDPKKISLMMQQADAENY